MDDGRVGVASLHSPPIVEGGFNLLSIDKLVFSDESVRSLSCGHKGVSEVHVSLEAFWVQRTK